MVQIRKSTSLGVILVVFAVLCTTMVLAEDLMIQSFELDSTGEDIEVKPGETLKVSFDAVNVGTDDLEDIEVEMWFERSGTKLEDANGDKIRPTFDLNDIDAGDDKSVDYEFKIPWEVDDGDRWEIFVKLKARNPEDSSRIDFEENPGYFRVEKESHEVLVIASFEPNNIDCGDNVKLNVEVRNIGTNDEDDVNLTSVNKVIGIDQKDIFDLNDDPEKEDNAFKKTYSFNVNNNINPGVYELTVRAKYDNGYKEAYKTISLTVDQCSYSPPAADDSDDDSDDSTSSDQTTTQQPPVDTGATTQAPVTYVPATPSATATAASKSKEGMSTSTILLIVLGEIALVVMIVLVYLLVRKPKRPREPEF